VRREVRGVQHIEVLLDRARLDVIDTMLVGVRRPHAGGQRALQPRQARLHEHNVVVQLVGDAHRRGLWPTGQPPLGQQPLEQGVQLAGVELELPRTLAREPEKANVHFDVDHDFLRNRWVDAERGRSREHGREHGRALLARGGNTGYTW